MVFQEHRTVLLKMAVTWLNLAKRGTDHSQGQHDVATSIQRRTYPRATRLLAPASEDQPSIILSNSEAGQG
jgi:hypothetical protein